MRALVFIPKKTSCAYEFTRAEIFARLRSGAEARLSGIEPVDARKEYDAGDWEGLGTTVRYYGHNFDALVVALDEKDIPSSAARIAQTIGRIAAARPDLPVIAYVANPTPDTQFNLLSAGVGHVVAENQNPLTLAASIASAVGHRRTQLAAFGPLHLNLLTNEVLLNGGPAGLTKNEEMVLCHLYRRRGHLARVSEIIDALYTGRDSPEPKIVQVFVCKIRSKLSAICKESDYPDFGKSIETVWGKGYRLVTDGKSFEPRRGAHPGPERSDQPGLFN